MRTLSLNHGGRVRACTLVLPEKRDGAKVPAVIVLHGGGGNAKQAMAQTRFDRLAREQGFLAAFPEGTAALQDRALVWNAGHCCASAMRRNVDDVGFIRALIGVLVRDHGADPDRIYVTGMSNGGMMALRLGQELPGLLAGIAPVAGGMFGDEPEPKAGLSVLMVNGGRDRAVPLDGGRSALDQGRVLKAFDAPLAPARDTLAYWARAGHCGPDPVAQRPPGLPAGVGEEHYPGCAAGVEVAMVLLPEGGHAWPGAPRLRPGGDEPAPAPDATALIWEFFQRHRRNSGG